MEVCLERTARADYQAKSEYVIRPSPGQSALFEWSLDQGVMSSSHCEDGLYAY
jgi:hypothetical protein